MAACLPWCKIGFQKIVGGAICPEYNAIFTYRSHFCAPCLRQMFHLHNLCHMLTCIVCATWSTYAFDWMSTHLQMQETACIGRHQPCSPCSFIVPRPMLFEHCWLSMYQQPYAQIINCFSDAKHPTTLTNHWWRLQQTLVASHPGTLDENWSTCSGDGVKITHGM